MLGNGHVRSGSGPQKRASRKTGTALRPDPTRSTRRLGFQQSPQRLLYEPFSKAEDRDAADTPFAPR